jgi:lipopolysaccharide exporter
MGNYNHTESIAGKVIHGGLWLFALRMLTRVVGFSRAVILAIFLSPKDYGLFGIAMLCLATLETVSTTGFRQALIQQHDDIKPFLNVAWTVNIGRGIGLFLILIFSAPLVTRFFNAPDAVLVLQVMALVALVSGFRNTGVIVFQKELRFKENFFYEFPAVIMDLAVSIVMAFSLRNVWALVFGALASACMRLIMSYAIHPHRPAIEFDGGKFRDLFTFGRWVTGSNLLLFIVTRGDDFVVARMFDTASLGIYQMAHRLSITLVSELNHAISRLMFPAYASFQGNDIRLKKAFLLTLNAVAGLSVPIVLVLFVFIPDFTVLVIGTKWKPIVSIVRILVIGGWLRSISAIWGALYLARGVPRNIFIKNLLRVVVTYAPIYFWASFFGVPGVAGALLFGIAFAFLYDMYYTHSICDLAITLRDIRSILLFYLSGGLVTAAIVILIKHLFPADVVVFLVLITISCLVYCATIYLLNRLVRFSPFADLMRAIRLLFNEYTFKK